MPATAAPWAGLLAAGALALPGAWLAQSLLGLELRLGPGAVWLWPLVLAPVLEETLLRPWVQQGLHDRLAATPATARHAGHAANVAVALLFAALHAPQHGPRALWWLVPALLFGEVWRRTRRLAPCILLHLWCNLSLAAATAAAASRG